MKHYSSVKNDPEHGTLKSGARNFPLEGLGTPQQHNVDRQYLRLRFVSTLGFWPLLSHQAEMETRILPLQGKSFMSQALESGEIISILISLVPWRPAL